MKDSIRDRIKVTKTGKLLRRPMGIGHARARKSSRQLGRKALSREIGPMDVKAFKKYI